MAQFSVTKYPGTLFNVLVISGEIAWSNPENAASNDNTFATLSITGWLYSQYLTGTNFGFSIPSGAVITGVQVNINRRASKSSGTSDWVRDREVYLRTGSAFSGSNKANSSLNWPTTLTYASYGGPNDLWGLALTPEIINQSSFGVGLSVSAQSSVNYIYGYVDSVSLTVYYTYSAPYSPTGLTRGNFDATSSTEFSWLFADPDNDPQGAYQLQIVDVSTGTTVYDSGKVISASSKATLPANTLSNGKQYQWRVKTWDPSNNEGPWSSYATFRTSSTPVCTILTPNTATVNIPQPTITWSYYDSESTTQSQYRIVVSETNSGRIHIDSGVVGDSSTVFVLPSPLNNDTSYIIYLTVYDEIGLSTTAVKTFLTSFVGPQKPLAYATVDNARGAVVLSINNPTPQTDDPEFAYNEIWRKGPGEVGFIRVATNLPWNGTYTDYTPASEAEYQYYARSVAVTTGYTNSDPTAVTVALQSTQLSSVANPARYVNIRHNIQRSVSIDLHKSLLSFAGRAAPVAEFGEQTDVDVTLNTTLRSQDLQTLMQMADAREILLYRDTRGRREFVTLGKLSVKDYGRPGYYDVSMTLERTSHTEAV